MTSVRRMSLCAITHCDVHQIHNAYPIEEQHEEAPSGMKTPHSGI